MSRWDKKNWDAILRDLSSGEDSDEGDSLNVQSVQKNAHRVAEMLHGALPGLDPSVMRTPPMGMNSMEPLREGFEAIAKATQEANGEIAPSEATGSAAGPSASAPPPAAASPGAEPTTSAGEAPRATDAA